MRTNLIKAREGLKLSQSEVARRAGISRAEYNRMENSNRNILISTARRIADVLGLEFDPLRLFEIDEG